MIRVGDKVAPFFNMLKVGTVVSIETATNNNVLTTEGTTSGTQFAYVKMDSSGQEIQRYRLDDLLKADM